MGTKTNLKKNANDVESSQKYKNNNGHIRDDDNCAIYYKIKHLSRKTRHNKGRGTSWGARGDIDRHMLYRFHLTEEEK